MDNTEPVESKARFTGDKAILTCSKCGRLVILPLDLLSIKDIERCTKRYICGLHDDDE